MAKKKSNQGQSGVHVGNISGVNGSVNIAGRDITTHETVSGISVTEIQSLFESLYAAIETRQETSPSDKEDLKAEVEEIQTTVEEAVQKNEKIEEGFLTRRFRNIARVSPDILDVVVTTLGNPLAGLGVAFRKIAEKAKEETSNNQSN